MLDGIFFFFFKLQFHQSPVLGVNALMSTLWTLLHFDDCAAGYRLKSTLSGSLLPVRSLFLFFLS